MAKMSDAVFDKGEVLTPPRAGKGEPLQQIAFWVPATAHRQLKVLAMDLRKPQKEALREALNDFFAKHKKPPIA